MINVLALGLIFFIMLVIIYITEYVKEKKRIRTFKTLETLEKDKPISIVAERGELKFYCEKPSLSGNVKIFREETGKLAKLYVANRTVFENYKKLTNTVGKLLEFEKEELKKLKNYHDDLTRNYK